MKKLHHDETPPTEESPNGCWRPGLTLAITVAALLLGAVAAFGQEYSMGWKPTPHGMPGAPINTHPAYRIAPLPASATVRKWYYRTNQKDRGACVAFSGAEAYDAVHQKDYRGQHMRISFLDAYQNCLVRDGGFPGDNGTYGSTLLKVLEAGVLTEKVWPYSKPLEQLAPATKKNAEIRAKHVTIKSYAIPTGDAGFATRQSIANLQVGVLMGSWWYRNGFDAKLVTCRTIMDGKSGTVERYVLPYPQGVPQGGHEVVIVGYDDNMVFPDGRIGGVEIHNHWGDWGDDRGCCWIPAAWAFNRRIVDDLHVIELVGPRKPALVPAAAILTP